MGQQNVLYTCPMLDVGPQRHPEPCLVSYGGVTCFPQPYNSHTILPPPGRRTTFDPPYLPENHGQLPYIMMPSPSAGVFSVPMNHDHLPFPNNHQIYERARSLYMDGPNCVFKRSGSSVPTDVMGFDFDPMVAHNSSHLVHGGQLVHAVPTPWLDPHSATGVFSLNRAHGGPYLQDMALHGYQGAAMSRNSPTFMQPPPMRPRHGPHNVYHPPPLPPMAALQPQNMDIQLQLPSTSHRHTTSTSSTYPFQNDADPGPRFVSPTMPHGVMVYEARRQPLMIDSISGHYFPHLRFLPVDEQGGQFGNKDLGLSDDFISDHGKVRIFTSSKSSPADEEPNFCVICQMDFEDQERIRVLDCRHEYHVECISKWFNVKRNCPICKSIALY
ncbi:putative transcription factor C2H2 family [Helianthus debilis subsp. tardiflorus]